MNVGQSTRIKIDAFDYSRFGALKGEVESISPTTSQSERGEIYYEVVVSVETPYFRDNPESFSILPGMTGEVDITTGEKSVFPIPLEANLHQHQRCIRRKVTQRVTTVSLSRTIQETIIKKGAHSVLPFVFRH